MSTIEKKSVSTGKFVTVEHLESLISNYKQERWIHNSERMGEEDTLGVYFDLDGLEEFIRVARQSGADGVNVCFGVYNENTRPEYAGKQTVALLATRSVEEYGDTLVEMNGDPGPGPASSPSTTSIPSTGVPIFNAGYPFGLNRKPATEAHSLSTNRLGVTIVTDKNDRMHVI